MTPWGLAGLASAVPWALAAKAEPQKLLSNWTQTVSIDWEGVVHAPWIVASRRYWKTLAACNRSRYQHFIHVSLQAKDSSGFEQDGITYVSYDDPSLFLLLRRGSTHGAERRPLRFGYLAFPAVRWAIVDGHEARVAHTTSHFTTIAQEVIVARGITREGCKEESRFSVCTRAVSKKMTSQIYCCNNGPCQGITYRHHCRRRRRTTAYPVASSPPARVSGYS